MNIYTDQNNISVSSFDKIHAICFYLPQFYPTAFNDRAWGRGFTDWANVASAPRLFANHYQPKVPSILGFYDLRRPQVIEEQAALATEYGIYGFCFYYYRFGASRLLEVPVENFLKRPAPDFPFCLCWANESWTRAWDGRSSEVLIEQTYDTTTFDGLVADLSRAVSDERYIRLANHPIFLIYQIEKIPNACDWINRLRDAVFRISGDELSIAAVFSHGFRTEMSGWVDFVVQFPPHRMPRILPRELLENSPLQFRPECETIFESYESVINGALAGLSSLENLCPGVCPDWDNSPRRRHKAHVLVGGMPTAFLRWVREAGRDAIHKAREGRIPAPLLFVNAWNEWAEGAMLEPTQVYGLAYLEALRDGITLANTNTAT